MTPCFRSFILLQLWSHSFHIFHRGCLCLHYLLRSNPMHWWRSKRHYTATCTTSSKSLSTTNTSSSRTLFEQMEPKFFLTFTCTVADCGEHLTLQFPNKHTGRVSYSYNFQDAIADHLGWFKESTQDGKLYEGLLKAKGKKVRRGKLDLDGHGTVEEYIEWGKDLENWAGCARFLALLWWFLVPTNMY